MNTQINNFWKNQIKILSWNKIPKKIFNEKKKNYFEWFADGKLNLTFNCIQKNIDLGFGKKIAIYFYDKDFNKKSYTYKDLSELIDKFIYIINKRINRSKKNVILIHGSASIETTIAILSCAKLGIHFSVIFEDLPKKAIDLRIKILKPTLIITRFDINKCRKTFSFSNLLIFSNSKKKNKKIYQISVNKLKKTKMKKIDYSFFYSNKTLFTLFTSGSTGEPKGIQHSTGGYLLYSKYTCMNQFGMNKDSVVLTASDAGWINGHTYSLFGPLFFGGTSILLESPIIILNENILKKIKNLKISILYLPVTLIRLLKSVTKRKNFFIKSIKALGSMGEPLAPDIGEWYEKFFRNKSKAVVNTYFQTETGGILISPKYNDNIFKSPHGSVGNPVSKFIEISKLDKFKREIKILYPWPGIMSDVLNGKKVWNKYWDKRGKFRLFDLASKEKKAIYIHGRIDDVINIRGHRIGSEEIESILLTNDKVFECCAVSINDEIEGSKFLVFIVGKKNLNKNELIELVIKNFGTFAIPKNIITLSELPKTRSGKILRRLLRDIANNDYEINDISTMINPHIINEIKNRIRS